MPPTPQQSSHWSIEDVQWQTEMEVQESSRNAREGKVTARMEQYLNARDCMKLEIKELELQLGPEGSEVNLRYILRNASRKGGRIFEIFNTKEEREHLVVSKVRWDERQRLKVAQGERARRNVQEAGDEVDRRMMPPTQQSSSMPTEEMQWQTEMEVQGSSWSAREITVFCKIGKLLEQERLLESGY